MVDLVDRVRGWVRPPGRHGLAAFVSLSAATQLDAVWSLLTSIALVRTTGAETAGKVFFAQSLASIWFAFWDPRFDDAAQRFIPAHQAAGPGHGTWLFNRLLRLDVAAGVAATALGAAAVTTIGAAGWTAVDVSLILLALLGAGAAAPLGTAWAGYAAIGRLNAVGGLRAAASSGSFACTMTALLLAGPQAFLAASAIAALITSVVMSLAGRRAVAAALGPPPAGPVAAPRGLVRFAVKCSVTTSVVGAVDHGLLVLAGVLGGSSLVAFLKIASAPGRLYFSLVSAAPAQLFPRMAAAAVAGDGARIRRDGLRATILLTLLGGLAAVTGALAIGDALAIVYGEQYRWLASPAAVLLVASCIRGAVGWSKILSPALGRPGVRLGYVTAEGILSLTLLAVIAGTAVDPSAVPHRFAWADLGLAAARAAAWLVLLSALTRNLGRDLR
jgi:O-antigen/teichoic acid export membrane protein